MAPNDRRAILARRAYELGRARAALRGAALVIPMTAASLACCNRAAVSLALGAILFVLAALALFVGRVYGRAVGPGLLAGAVPLLLPLVMTWCGYDCSTGECARPWMSACIAAGLVAGAIVGWASRRERDALSFVVVAGAFAALAGAMGCVAAGASGILAMLVALALSSVPQAAWAPAAPLE